MLGSYENCLGTLLAYCPAATLFYETFVVREARQNHGPLLLPGDREYASVKRPSTPRPACSAMFTLLSANSHFLCQNIETTANYSIDAARDAAEAAAAESAPVEEVKPAQPVGKNPRSSAKRK